MREKKLERKKGGSEGKEVRKEGRSNNPMDNLREILVSEITGLKSLLRLNADGVGDDDDLVAQLTRYGAFMIIYPY